MRKILSGVNLLSLLLVFVSSLIFNFLYAQMGEAVPSETPTEMGGLEKPIVSEEYILMPGDEVLVTITGATNYSYKSTVTFEGKVTIEIPVTSLPTAQGVYMPKYDVVNAIPIYNLSLKAAKDSLKHVFLKYYRNIKVDITLLGMRMFTVFVVGEVQNPGMVSAWPIDRVSVVIQRAGGVTTLGSRSKIELMRNKALYKIANLEEFEKTGNSSVNPYVQDGDLIVISEMEQSVIVKGAVFGKRGYELRVAELTAARERTSEGLYELDKGERVANLITKAGGTTPWADLENTYIERGGEKIFINLTNVLADENSEDNIEMIDGDILVIPSVNAIVYVQGKVTNPGSYPFQPNLRASDYIGLAGGPLEDAYMSGAYVQRERGKMSVKKNPVIEEGDRIYVPRQIFKFWQDYVEIGAVFASLLISYLTLTK
jgi:protein involved in polysaccharide export with SLBB domain